MRNRFNIGELVKVNGKGKLYGKVIDKLGIIKEKDTHYLDYYVKLIFGKKDWYEESSITRILGEKENITDTYQVGLCTSKKGYKLILENLKKIEPIRNNKINQVDILRGFIRNKNRYIILGWKSINWPTTNKSINCIEDTIRSFRKQDIPYQYIVMNENNVQDIEILEFSVNDENVKVFEIKRKIMVRGVKL